jgi:hypothetical protein
MFIDTNITKWQSSEGAQCLGDKLAATFRSDGAVKVMQLVL